MLKRARSPKKIAEYEAALALPDFPRALGYLWSRFTRLRNRRTSSGFGSNPITWQDIVFFQQLSGVHFQPWEVEIIEDLDNIDRAEQARSLTTNQTDNGSDR